MAGEWQEGTQIPLSTFSVQSSGDASQCVFIIPRKSLRKITTTVIQNSLAKQDQTMEMTGFGVGLWKGTGLKVFL